MFEHKAASLLYITRFKKLITVVQLWGSLLDLVEGFR